MRRKILVADDSVTVRKVIELTFSDGDFDIVSVADGSVALERAKGDRPDIIISDVGMPGLDGYELCRRVKSDPQLQSVPFLFLKGSFESFDEDRAGRCGADGFIVKPFESQEMIRRVTQMIGAAPARPHAAPAAVEEPSTPPAPIAEPTATPPPPTIAPAIPEPPPPPPRFPEDDFVHALGIDDEDLTPPRAAPHGATAAPGTTGTEAEEDLWSEVSLRDRPAPVLGGQGEEDTLWESEPVNLLDETVEPAEEEVFEEISTARRETPAPPRLEAAPPVAPPAPAPAAPPAPVAPTAPEAPSSAPELTREDLERLIAARLDPLLRDILPSLLGESARRVIDEVAWEVVPDLAEAMIRREIERIKRSAGRG